MDKIISSRLGKNNLGFGADTKKKRQPLKKSILRSVEPEDLLKFGLIPELIGRLPIIAVLEELGEKALMDILQKPKNALTKQYGRLFEMDGVELEFEQEALHSLVQIAKKRGTGARALRSIFEEIMLDSMYEIPSRRDIKRLIITKDVVLKKAEPIYTYKVVKKSA